MKREQQEVLSLLKEIDKICAKHKIEYCLSPQLTLCGVTDQSFPQNPLAGVILMKIGEMERFRRVFEEESPQGRMLEYMGNSKYFPGFYLRYVNTNTLCYRLNEGKNFRYPGMGVDILPLRGKITSRRKHLWNRILEVGWQQTCYSYSGKPGIKNILCKIPIKMKWLLRGRALLGKDLYEKFVREQDVLDTEEYILRLDRNTTYYYPAEIFHKQGQMTLEGEQFQAPDEKIWFLQKTYGRDYEEQAAEEYKPDPAVMTSALVGYEEFFQETGDPKKLIKARRKQYLKDSIGRRRQRYYNWCWSYAKLCAGKRKLNAYYSERKDYIKNLYKSGDYMRLETIFRPYTKLMLRCLKEKEIYVADEEILEIYLAVLKITGNEELKGQIEKYWR